MLRNLLQKVDYFRKMNKIIYIEKNIRIGDDMVKKYKRNERVGAIVRLLVDSPNKIFTLNCFTELFNSAKSTISEDLMIIKTVMEENNLGVVETITGAAGGVKYIPHISTEKRNELLSDIIEFMSDSKRVMPGGFIYMADILSHPRFVKPLGEIFASEFYDKDVDCVVTVETKGIPLATMTAQALNVPLVIFRNDNRAADGSTISIHYVSGSTGRLQKMYVSKRAIKPESNILIIDDFMKAGGTAKGMTDLVKEFDAKIVGIGVLFESENPKEKLVEDYHSLITMKEDQEKGTFEFCISEQ